MSIYEIVATALSTLGVPFSLIKKENATGSSLPDLFIEYHVPVSTPESFADDAEKERSYLVQVNVWNRDGLVSLPDVDSAMIAQGFVPGPRTELPYSEETKHFGLAYEYRYLETKE